MTAAKQIEETARFLLGERGEASWAVVLAFYSALHWADSYLARANLHPIDHRIRERYVAQTELRDVFFDFKRLRTRSEDVRYNLETVSAAEAQRLIDQELARVKAQAERLLARP